VCLAYACRLRTVSIDVGHFRGDTPSALGDTHHSFPQEARTTQSITHRSANALMTRAGMHCCALAVWPTPDAVNHALKCKRTDDARRNALLCTRCVANALICPPHTTTHRASAQIVEVMQVCAKRFAVLADAAGMPATSRKEIATLYKRELNTSA
jgi:hypothetical protein